MPTIVQPSGPPASPDPDRVGSAGTPFGPGRSVLAARGSSRQARKLQVGTDRHHRPDRHDGRSGHRRRWGIRRGRRDRRLAALGGTTVFTIAPKGRTNDWPEARSITDPTIWPGTASPAARLHPARRALCWDRRRSARRRHHGMTRLGRS